MRRLFTLLLVALLMTGMASAPAFAEELPAYTGEPVELTPKEYDLLEELVVNRNIALSRDKLLENVWGYDYMGDTRTIDVHIQKLRKKLGWENRIVTVYKLGYRLEANG